jgi:hypothetical protein
VVTFHFHGRLTTRFASINSVRAAQTLKRTLRHRYLIPTSHILQETHTAWSNYCALYNNTIAINHPVACGLHDRSQPHRTSICARLHSTEMTSQNFNLIQPIYSGSKIHTNIVVSRKTGAFSTSCISVEWMAVNDELGRILTERVVIYFKALSLHFPGRM